MTKYRPEPNTLSRRSLLLGGTAALGSSLFAGKGVAGAAADGPARNLLLVVAPGGWDTTYAVDPKPGRDAVDVPPGTIQEFGGIEIYTDPSRPSVTEFFSAHAGICAVVNGIQVLSIAHPDCFRRILTGTTSDVSPDFGSIVAHECGRDLPSPYLVLGRTSYSGPYASIAARSGTTNQIGTLLDPEAAFESPDPDHVSFVPDPTESDLIRDVVLARAEREKGNRGQRGYNRDRLQDFIDSLGRGDSLAALGNFGDLEFTPELSVQVDIAARAVERGLCRVVQLEAGDWDTHENNALQTELHESFFSGLKRLVDEFATRPGSTAGSKLLDETVIAVVSEMGRTPKLNAQGGKDHWPVTSALVLGAGVNGGTTVGGTDDRLEALNIDFATGTPDGETRPLLYGDFVASMLELAGVDASAYLPNARSISALFA